jgi:L-asparaginase
VNILFIQTGGTIDKAYPKTNHGYAFEIDSPAFTRILERARVKASFEQVTLCRKDSTEVTGEDRLALKHLIQESSFQYIVITHGSDTLIETARFLGNIKGKTIVLTGAFLPETFKDSDADFNLGLAVAAVQLAKAGTYIAMNGQVLNPAACIKNNKSGNFEKTYE